MIAVPARRYLRLLPSVMLVCSGLLVLKASGIVHDAYALDGAPAGSDAMSAAPAAANKDYAEEGTQMASAAEVDVLTSLTKRSAELDARQAQIQIQANMLAATESRVDAKIAQLKTLQDQIKQLLDQRDQAQKDQVAALVKTFKNMDAKKAAAVFQGLPEEVSLPVAQTMSAADLATIMNNMSPDAAQKLTIKMADKLNLPDTTPAMTPATPPAPGAQAAATPAAPPAPGAKAPAATAPKTGG